MSEPSIFQRNLTEIKLNTRIEAVLEAGAAKTREEALTRLADSKDPVYVSWHKTIKSMPLLKRAEAMVTTGEVPDQTEAYLAIGKSDPEAYERYRQSSYVSGRMPQAERGGMAKAAKDGPVLARLKAMAKDMKTNDVYGEHKGKSEMDLIQHIFGERPDLYAEYRKESIDQ